MSTMLETRARGLWTAWAEWQKRTTCSCCRAMRWCGRHTRRGRWLCLPCFDTSPEADRFQKRQEATR